MTAVVTASLALLAVAGLLCLAAVLRPGTIADRAVAFDATVAVIVCGLAVGAVRSGDGLFADLALVLGLLGFLATTTVARYLAARRP